MRFHFIKFSALSDIGSRTLIMAEGHDFNYLFVLLTWKMSDVEIR